MEKEIPHCHAPAPHWEGARETLGLDRAVAPFGGIFATELSTKAGEARWKTRRKSRREARPWMLTGQVLSIQRLVLQHMTYMTNVYKLQGLEAEICMKHLDTSRQYGPILQY